jgi:hypothetical protein
MIEKFVPLCKHCQSSALEIQGAKRFHYAKDAPEGAEPIRIESSPVKNRSKLRSIEIELTDEQAHALAQYLKRIQFDDFRRWAIDENDAYVMQNAAAEVRKALADAGYDPR